MFLWQSNLIILREMAVLIAQNFKNKPDRGNFFSMHKCVWLLLKPLVDSKVEPKLVDNNPCCFHSKDGDNEFMNIIANEIGFQVKHIFYTLNGMYSHCYSEVLEVGAWFILSLLCLCRIQWSFWPWARRRVQDCSCSQGLRIPSLKWHLGETYESLFPFVLPIFNPVKPDILNNSKQNLNCSNGILYGKFSQSLENIC